MSGVSAADAAAIICALRKRAAALAASMAAGPHWACTEAKLVHAARCATPAKLYALSVADTELYLSVDFLELSWFFAQAPELPCLEAALARALDAFPTLAGRAVTGATAGKGDAVRRTGDSHRGIFRAVSCGNQGATLLVLALPTTELPRDREAATQLPPWPACDYSMSFCACQDDERKPLFAVELINFRSGSILTVRSLRARPAGRPCHSLPSVLLMLVRIMQSTCCYLGSKSTVRCCDAIDCSASHSHV